MHQRKQQARLAEAERAKHKARLQLAGSGGQGGRQYVSSTDVDRAVTQAHVDRLRSCLPSMKDIKRLHYKRQSDAVMRERQQRIAQLPASRVLPHNWSIADFAEPKPQAQAQQQAQAQAQQQPGKEDLGALHGEIEGFAKYTCLTQHETELRETVIREITDAILSKWPKAVVRIFGSFPSGLSIYTSDLDISVQNVGVELEFDGGGFVSPSVFSAPKDLPIVVDLTGDVADGKAEEENDQGEIEVTWTMDVGTRATAAASSAEATVGAPIAATLDATSSATEQADESAAGSKRKREHEDEDEEEGEDEDAQEEGMGDGQSDESDQDEEDPNDGSDDSGSLGDGDAGGNDGGDDDIELNLAAGGDTVSSSSGGGGKSKASTAWEAETKLRMQNLLRLLAAHLQPMGWCSQMEVRAKARVPIIALTHRSGVSVDISLGVAAEDHTTTVKQMIQSCGFLDFFPLCSFLKIFLAQLDLDKPYIGGIGSFKLYAMVTAIITKYQSSLKTTTTTATSGPGALSAPGSAHRLAHILRLFFRHWGSPQNLNNKTVLVVPLPKLVDSSAKNQPDKLEVPFERVFKVDALQQAFSVANRVLGDALTYSRPARCSILGRLVDSKGLALERRKHMNAANQYPKYSMRSKVAVAEQVLAEIQRRNKYANPLSLEQINSVSPELATRLLSFRDAREALGHLTLFGDALGGGGGGRSHPHKKAKVPQLDTMRDPSHQKKAKVPKNKAQKLMQKQQKQKQEQKQQKQKLRMI